MPESGSKLLELSRCLRSPSLRGATLRLMLRNAIRRIPALSLTLLLVTLSAAEHDYKALLGKWSMTSETSGDPVQWTLLLKEKDGALAASLSSEDGEQPATDVSYRDGLLRFKAPYQGAYYDVELRGSGDKLQGTWSGGGDSGRSTGRRYDH